MVWNLKLYDGFFSAVPKDHFSVLHGKHGGRFNGERTREIARERRSCLARRFNRRVIGAS